MTGKKRGPRPEGGNAREDILEAARTTFSEVGYHRATIRLIAQSAAVDPALVMHYFGSKDGLFAAAVKLPMAPEQAFDLILDGPKEEIGSRLAALFFRAWENPATRDALIGQLGVAFTGERPPPMRDFLAEAVFTRLEKGIEGPNAKLRIELAAAQLIGVAILRYVLALEPIASAPIERLISDIGPRVSSYLLPPGKQ